MRRRSQTRRRCGLAATSSVSNLSSYAASKWMRGITICDQTIPPTIQNATLTTPDCHEHAFR